jgi:hypothetical protein
MELRWVIYQNQVTAKQVAAHAAALPCPMQEAKRVLQARTLPVLQYRQGMGFEWQDVPTEVLPHKERS